MEQDETLDLTPSPRILEVIAETDLQIHQCLAELIDNCFDELQKAREADPHHERRVDITIPVSRQVRRDSVVVVADTGRGMTPEQMRHALRAGSTDNGQFGTLGLFGMGFNIATARLGTITEVRSGRAGDDFWSIATIDIQQMQRADSYRVPLTQTPKARNEQGTIITVSRLREDTIQRLQRPSELTRIRSQLGNIYSYMLRDPARSAFSGSDVVGGLGLSLYLNGNSIKPTLPCIWDPARSVPYKGQSVHAVQRLDFPLSTAWACMACGLWHTLATDVCPQCESSDVVERERRITGWLGVQRFLDSSDFGISIIRQGRVIVHRDKSLFEWIDDDETQQVEYPVEVGGGRIVGEVHLDHAPVNFRKTDFDRSSRAWTSMRRLVRGEAPLRPRKAAELGYAENDSILGKLFNAYRRNDPGLRCLIPGTGKGSMHERSREWAKQFAAGDPEYATDAAWFEAARLHDEIAAGKSSEPPSGAREADSAWLEAEGLGHLLGSSADAEGGESGDGETPTLPSPHPTTAEERFALYRDHAVPLPALDGRTTIAGTATELRCFVTSGMDLSPEGISEHFAIRLSGGVAEIFVASEHPLHVDYGWALEDVAMVCASSPLANVYQHPGSLPDVILEMLQTHPERRLEYATVRGIAEGLTDRIRESMEPIVRANAAEAWRALSSSSKRAAEQEASRTTPGVDWMSIIEEGSFAKYLTVSGVRDLVAAMPQILLDGGAFSTTFSGWSDEAARADQVDRIEVLLSDLGRMSQVGRATTARELSRYLLTAELIERELQQR